MKNTPLNKLKDMMQELKEIKIIQEKHDERTVLRARKISNRMRFYAISGNDYPLKALLASGENPNQTETDGKTLLMWAAEYGNDTTVGILLDFGADINAQNYIGWSALMWAAQEQYVKSVRVLIFRGANPNLRDRNNDTALLSAVGQKNNDEVIKDLLSAGCEVNACNDEGKTALMLAAKYGSINTVRMLLKSGADIGLIDNEGRDALDYASKANRNDTLGTLRASLSKDFLKM